MTHHFGALIPSTNTTVEIEYSHLLPADIAQAHYGRMMSSNYGTSPFSPRRSTPMSSTRQSCSAPRGSR